MFYILRAEVTQSLNQHTNYGLDHGVQLPTGAKDSLPASGIHPASYSMGTGGPFSYGRGVTLTTLPHTAPMSGTCGSRFMECTGNSLNSVLQLILCNEMQMKEDLNLL